MKNITWWPSSPATTLAYESNCSCLNGHLMWAVDDLVPRPEDSMSIWTILFVLLLIAWIGGFTVFHVAGGLIHLLLVLAVISLILHFVRGTRTA